MICSFLPRGVMASCQTTSKLYFFPPFFYLLFLPFLCQLQSLQSGCHVAVYSEVFVSVLYQLHQMDHLNFFFKQAEHTGRLLLKHKSTWAQTIKVLWSTGGELSRRQVLTFPKCLHSSWFCLVPCVRPLSLHWESAGNVKVKSESFADQMKTCTHKRLWLNFSLWTNASKSTKIKLTITFLAQPFCVCFNI